VLVALDVGQQAGFGRVDASPAERRLGEQDVGALALQAILQQAVRQDDVDPGRLAAVTDHLAQEPAVVRDDLEVEIPDAPASAAGAGVVRRQFAPSPPEGGDGVLEGLEEYRGWSDRPVWADREDRVTFDLLDLQGWGKALHDLAQQLGDDRRAVLELGRGDEGRETGDVRQDQYPVFRVGLHALETPERGIREARWGVIGRW
jgi:hypothetical protein